MISKLVKHETAVQSITQHHHYSMPDRMFSVDAGVTKIRILIKKNLTIKAFSYSS